MKPIPVLVVTKETQGQRTSDFCFADEGEVAVLGSTCDRDLNNPDPDGGCGCGRALVGAITHKATTTVKVELREFTGPSFTAYYLGAFQDSGWLRGDTDGTLRGILAEDAAEVLRIARAFPVGTVLERRKNQRIGAFFQARRNATDTKINDALKNLR